jgi:hypothetical protein
LHGADLAGLAELGELDLAIWADLHPLGAVDRRGSAHLLEVLKK